MKKYVWLIVLLGLVLACAKDDADNVGDSMEKEKVELTVKPYSCDINSKGIVVVYQFTGATKVEANYREQLSDNWTAVEAEINGDKATISLMDLVLMRYYEIMVTVYNEDGQSLMDRFLVKYDYDAYKETYYMQPYIAWGDLLSNVKTALSDRGNVLDSEKETEKGFLLTYKFIYKELYSEYCFDKEKKLKEVLIYFDKERVGMEELRRFVSQAFGYMSFGNIHVSFDGVEQICSLYKTVEASSYAFMYEDESHIVIDYISAANVNPSDVLYK